MQPEGRCCPINIYYVKRFRREGRAESRYCGRTFAGGERHTQTAGAVLHDYSPILGGGLMNIFPVLGFAFAFLFIGFLLGLRARPQCQKGETLLAMEDSASRPLRFRIEPRGEREAIEEVVDPRVYMPTRLDELGASSMTALHPLPDHNGHITRGGVYRICESMGIPGGPPLSWKNSDQVCTNYHKYLGGAPGPRLPLPPLRFKRSEPR